TEYEIELTVQQRAENRAAGVGRLSVERHLFGLDAVENGLVVELRGDKVRRHAYCRSHQEDVQEGQPNLRAGESVGSAGQQRSIPLERIAFRRHALVLQNHSPREEV